MSKFLNNSKVNWMVAIAACLMFSQCTKSKLDDDFQVGNPPPVAGGYTNSSEIEPSNLVAYFPFDGNIADNKGTVTGGVLTGTSNFQGGIKGQAYQGKTGTFITYANPGLVAGLTSFTVSFWINTQKHDGGAQGIFGLGKADGSFWGNFFVIIEGNNTSSNKMQSKLHFEKNVTPSIPNTENWVDPAEALRPNDMYGAWRQITYTYDETTSKVAYYANGQAIDIGNDANRTSNGTAPLGPLAFKSATKFVIGGYQNHAGAPFGGLEPWMLNYTGKLDEMRIYKKALTSQQVSALYQLERQGR
ncbi:LamG-like jellyroll fold domain-containing protein [Pedobacter nototheniae]|uniref:LamG-like jellyroll fold domain-containing protein n=1 Tax=Pedobacter nototheniae TaxID=2488994 RepID=UPI002931128A|nr:LamG-like jellyroll fold domain-containing protein [Pedobacter nototheniae]